MQWCFFEKQMGGIGGGGGRDGRNQSTKIRVDSPVKIIEKKKKAAEIQRLTNSEQHSTPTLCEVHLGRQGYG